MNINKFNKQLDVFEEKCIVPVKHMVFITRIIDYMLCDIDRLKTAGFSDHELIISLSKPLYNAIKNHKSDYNIESFCLYDNCFEFFDNIRVITYESNFFEYNIGLGRIFEKEANYD